MTNLLIVKLVNTDLPRLIRMPDILVRQTNHCMTKLSEGLYPQRDGSLAIVHIDAFKGFVDLWLHLSLAIFAIFDQKRQLKLLEMAFDQVQTCLIFPFRWAHFPIKNGRKTQWVHPFSMNFNGFRSVCLYISLIVHFR